MEHVISVLVENRFGVLAHIAGMFSGRGFNIDSLAVGTTVDPSISRMTIVTRGDDRVVSQIVKQLNRQVDVVEVTDLSGSSFVERELMLVKVAGDGQTRGQIIEIASVFRAKVVDVQRETLVIEAAGSAEKLQAMLELLEPHGIKEIVRTGRIGMPRG